MYHQSTAQRSRAARFQDAAVAALIILGLGAWAGTAAYDVAHAPPVVAAAPTPPTRPTAPRGWAVGDTVAFDQDTPVWVDETGLWAYNRAEENRDGKGTSAAMGLWERFTIPGGTLLTITNIRGDAIQVELGDGSLRGRRGWHTWGALMKRR